MMTLVRSPMTLVMLSIFVVMVGVAATYPPDARFMPFVVGIPAIGLCLLQLFLDWRAGESAELKDNRSEFEKAEERISLMVGRRVEFDVAREPSEVQVVEHSDEVAQNREFIIWGYVLGFVAAILFFGFWLAIPAFIGIFLNREAHYSPLKAAIYAGVGGGFLFVVFNFGLKLKLHSGFLADWLF